MYLWFVDDQEAETKHFVEKDASKTQSRVREKNTLTRQSCV